MSTWDDLLDDDTLTIAECGACSWQARGEGAERAREVLAEADEHSNLHLGVKVTLDAIPAEPADPAPVSATATLSTAAPLPKRVPGEALAAGGWSPRQGDPAED